MKYFTILLLAVTMALTANAQTEIKKEYPSGADMQPSQVAKRICARKTFKLRAKEFLFLKSKQGTDTLPHNPILNICASER